MLGRNYVTMNTSSNSSIYPSLLLNDLHTYFPRLLYRPEEFQSVQDVLQYIISVASQSPYSRGQAHYQRTSTPSTASMSSSSSYPSTRRRTATTLPVRIVSSSYVPSSFSSLPATSAATASSSTFINTFADHFVSDLLNTMLTGNQSDVNNNLYTRILQESLQSFQPSQTIVPTHDELEQYTTIRNEPPESEHICSICQDAYDIHSECRILNACQHRFHRQCIDVWFQSHITCPVCRHDIRNPPS